MAMTRKHYREFAEILHDARCGPEYSQDDEIVRNVNHTVDQIANRMASVLRADNPRFDRQRFMEAVYGS